MSVRRSTRLLQSRATAWKIRVEAAAREEARKRREEAQAHEAELQDNMRIVGERANEGERQIVADAGRRANALLDE